MSVLPIPPDGSHRPSMPISWVEGCGSRSCMRLRMIHSTRGQQLAGFLINNGDGSEQSRSLILDHSAIRGHNGILKARENFMILNEIFKPSNLLDC